MSCDVFPKQIPDFKAGDTFSQVCYAALPAGTWTATGTLRLRNGSYVAELDVELGTPVPNPEVPTQMLTPIVVSYAGSTLNWPIGDCAFDVRFAEDDLVMHSNTVGVKIIAAITGPTP